jgi:hypothetical protein
MPQARVHISEIREAGGLKPWLERELRTVGARPALAPVPVKKPKPAKRSEHDEQALVIARAYALAPSMPALRLLHAIPNGGHRNKATAGKLKAEGVRRGVPDLCLPVPMGGYHGLYVEMKAQGGKASPEQLEWHAALRANGYRAEVCVGADAAWAVICEYLGIGQTCRA